jgi:hypothetical protein
MRSQALLEQNRDVLASYRVGMNVIVHPQPASLDNKVYGFVEGFCLNSLGELVLKIRCADSTVAGTVMRLHPLNSMNVIEIVG